MDKLDELRQQIDSIDAEIIAKISERFKVVTQVKEYKQQHLMAVYDKSREEYLKEFHTSLCQKYQISNQFINQLFDLIMQEAKRLQEAQ